MILEILVAWDVIMVHAICRNLRTADGNVAITCHPVFFSVTPAMVLFDYLVL